MEKNPIQVQNFGFFFQNPTTTEAFFFGKKVSQILLKIGLDEVQRKQIFEIFEFSDFAQKMWIKIRFKFENREKFYKGFPCKKNFPREFFVK